MSVGSRMTSALLPTPRVSPWPAAFLRKAPARNPSRYPKPTQPSTPDRQKLAGANPAQTPQPPPAAPPGPPKMGGSPVPAGGRGPPPLSPTSRLCLRNEGGTEKQARENEAPPRQSGLADRGGHGRRALAP